MTGSAASVFNGFFADALACTHCGSKDVFPAPGPFADLGLVVGLARHRCRPCGRLFWTKTSAEYTGVEEAELLEDSGAPPELLGARSEASADAVALDIDILHPEHEPVDLAALDAEFARRCASGKRRRRRRPQPGQKARPPARPSGMPRPTSSRSRERPLPVSDASYLKSQT